MDGDGVSDYTIDLKPFQKAASALDGKAYFRSQKKAISPAMRKAINRVRQLARLEARPHRKTGRMAGAIRTKMPWTGNSVMNAYAYVKANGGAAHLITGGVKPHKINSKKPMYLWGFSGMTEFSRHVQHPGFRADPFFSRAVTSAEPDVSAYFQQAADELAASMAKAIEGKG